MDARLRGAVDRLYDVFARVPRPAVIEFCDHCVQPDTVRPLLAATDPRNLAPDDLRPYAVRVLGTMGSVEDFRYFLPRLLDIASVDGFDGWPDLELLVGKLRRADWTSWRDDEQDAVRSWLEALPEPDHRLAV